ncbi:MAG: hypothetical protein ACD_23C00801G0002 [uncultured bacterium]|nr:MAG: hypothetical protein ACD_23C00801G0002 [uncultured bacterium]
MFILVRCAVALQKQELCAHQAHAFGAGLNGHAGLLGIGDIGGDLDRVTVRGRGGQVTAFAQGVARCQLAGNDCSCGVLVRLGDLQIDGADAAVDHGELTFGCCQQGAAGCHHGRQAQCSGQNCRV